MPKEVVVRRAVLRGSVGMKVAMQEAVQADLVRKADNALKAEAHAHEIF